MMSGAMALPDGMPPVAIGPGPMNSSAPTGCGLATSSTSGGAAGPTGTDRAARPGHHGVRRDGPRMQINGVVAVDPYEQPSEGERER